MNKIKMDANENPIMHNIDIKDVVGKVNPREYPDITCAAIKESLAELCKCNMDEILCTNGSDMLIKIITFMLVGSDETIIMPEVAFPTYRIAADLKGCNYYLSPLKDYKIDLEDMYKNITKDTKLIWLSNPHNPTGTLLDYRSIISFLDRVDKDIFVVLDEAYAEFVEGELMETFNFREKYPNLIVLRTLSKAYGLAGARIGYAIASGEIIKKLYKFVGPFDLNSYAQELGVAVLRDRDYIKKVQQINGIEMTKYVTFLNLINIQFIKSYTNFIMIHTKELTEKVYKELLANNIHVKNGEKIGMPGWLRISINLNHNNDKVINIIKTIYCKNEGTA